MDNKTDLRVIKTKKIIKNALIDLMAEKEIGSITITELSEKALINRKTFYRHYNSVSEVVTELENEILSEFAETLKDSKTSCLAVVGVVADMSALIERRREYFTKMMKLNPELFSTGRIKAMLRRAVAVSLKNVGGIDDADTCSALSQFIVSGVLSLYAEWFDNGCKDDLGKVTETARNVVTNGLRGFISEEKLTEVL